MKIDNKITIFALAAGFLALFLYLAKKKGVAKRSGRDPRESSAELSGGSATRGKRNNNPFNIRYNAANSWKGQTGSDGDFCVFDTMQHGIRAGGVLLRNYIKAGKNTIRLIISKFAPASENNTESYIKHVAQMSGIGEDVKLSNNDLWRIAAPMMIIESGYSATANDKEYFNNPNF